LEWTFQQCQKIKITTQMRGLARHEALWRSACLAVWKMHGRKAIKAMVHEQQFGESKRRRERSYERCIRMNGGGSSVTRE
jgi:hypothetical protein